MINAGLDILSNKIAFWIAWRLPKTLVYWAAIRMFVRATTGPYSGQAFPTLTASDALRRWGEGA